MLLCDHFPDIPTILPLLSLHLSWSDCSRRVLLWLYKNGYNLPISLYYAFSNYPLHSRTPPPPYWELNLLFPIVCSDAKVNSQWVLSPLEQRPLWYLIILYPRTTSTIPFTQVLPEPPRYLPTEPTIAPPPRPPHIPHPHPPHLTVNATLSILFPS